MTPGFFWLAITAGFLSVLTPCVFPMVPVTVAYFAPSSRAGSRGIKPALLFALGIIASFTALGLALAAVFGAAGLNRFASSPAVNLALAAMFLLFAANLFGWLEISLPSRFVNTAGRLSRDSDHRTSTGALVMGAVFTVTSLTCTAPFVGTLLVLAARGSWLTPLTGMLVYSAAFALPFFLLALAPSALSRLPRAGDWMQSLRILIGILEVGAAVKFASNADLVLRWGIFTRPVVLLAWSVLALAAGAYLARDIVSRATPQPPRLIRLAAVALALFTSGWLASGITGRTLTQVEAFLPPAEPSAVALASTADLQWTLNDYPAALRLAQASGKPVFIDFTGYTCTNCRWMEANIFNQPAVAAELSRFVLARLYTDGEGEPYERQQKFQEKTFGTVALPLYAVVDGDGNVRGTFSGLTRDPGRFAAFLRRARAVRVAGR